MLSQRTDPKFLGFCFGGRGTTPVISNTFVLTRVFDGRECSVSLKATEGFSSSEKGYSVDPLVGIFVAISLDFRGRWL